jgi:hypothetical protein
MAVQSPAMHKPIGFQVRGAAGFDTKRRVKSA